MEDEKFIQLIERMDKLTEAIYALVATVAIDREEQQEPDNNSETYLNGSPKIK